MNTIRKEVRDFIPLNERIQSALLQEESLTGTEMCIIRMCTTELLASLAGTHSRGSQPEWRDGDSISNPIT